MPILFGVTLFISATLLFLVQPMVGKMILPLLGGTPAVWNTCMVFFQALLLAGYYYAHKSSTHLPTRRQVKLHTGVLVLTIGVLALSAALIDSHSPVPIVKSFAPQGSEVPFFGVILLLAAAIGLPFFTISTTAPLLQKWFSETGHPSAKDPYFLYAASNFGSLLALVAYPFLVEPNLKLVQQAWVWAIGFGVLAAFILVCSKVVAKTPQIQVKGPAAVSAKGADSPAPHWKTRLRWLLLAAVPSSLMLAVTTSVTTDMVSMPLLWVIPLALYLVTFIIVFAKSTPTWVHTVATLVTPVLILLVMFTKIVPERSLEPTEMPKVVQHFLTLLPFITFFFVALTCHGELARSRPASQHLTGFYLTMSLGGVLGGLFNALFAPMVFTFVSEYPLTLVAAAWLVPSVSSLTDPSRAAQRRPWSIWDFLVPILFFAAGRFLSSGFKEITDHLYALMGRGGAIGPMFLATVIVFGLPTMCCYFLVDRPFRFGAAVGAVWFGTFMTFVIKEHKVDEDERTLYTRSFFGTMKIEEYHRRISETESSPRFKELIHGTTVHGMQHMEPDGVSIAQALMPLGTNGPVDGIALAWLAEPNYRFPGREPLTYYHRSGPVGLMFQLFWNRNDAHPGGNTDVAAIGLGTGSTSCYARPRETMSFFEIDPTVYRLVAETPKNFTYITRARQQGCNIEFIMGDARLSLERADRKWGFMLVDAFSSDSIPAHLLTKQAVQLYFNRLEDDGLLALHVSNRFLKLEPVVEAIARELKVEAIGMRDYINEDDNYLQPEFSGKFPSSWILLARKRESFGVLLDDPRWTPIRRDDTVGLWTDDYTPITSALKFGLWDLIAR